MNVSELYPQYNFEVIGASYAGKPKNNTVMYVTKKVEKLIDNLKDVSNCLCFCEKGMCVDQHIIEKNGIVFTDTPQLDYTIVINKLFHKIKEEDKKRKFTLMEAGFYLGENVKLGENCYIEPGVVIGHDVIIGNNANIFAGAVIKNAVIGNNFQCNENAVVGNYGFNMVEDEKGNKVRIPSLGRVIIGNNVEVGACTDIARGTGNDTIIEDNVKIDSLVHVGHDAFIKKNVEITAASVIGGFTILEEKAYMGINSCIKNRKHVGKNTVIGMGAVVTKELDDNKVYVGNPARILTK